MLKCKWTSFDKVSWKSQDATHSWPWTHYPHSHNGIPRICHCFLSKTKTPEEQKVTVPLTSFCEPSVANWAKMILCSQLYVHDVYEWVVKMLPPSLLGESAILKHHNTWMLSSKSFADFVDRIIAGNNLLEGSKFRLSIDQLCKTLISNMGEYLDSGWGQLQFQVWWEQVEYHCQAYSR